MAALLAKQVYQALGMPTDTGPVLSITPDIPVPIKTPAGLFYKVGESLDFRHHILKALIKTCRTLPTHNAAQAPLRVDAIVARTGRPEWSSELVCTSFYLRLHVASFSHLLSALL
jgi:hypothetical protein